MKWRYATHGLHTNALEQQTNDGDESAKRSRDRIYDVYCFSSTSGW